MNLHRRQTFAFLIFILSLLQDVLFYQLPLHAHFYSELVNAIGSGDAAQHATVTALFAPEDAGTLLVPLLSSNDTSQPNLATVGSSRSQCFLANWCHIWPLYEILAVI